jgi:hypothetical protein
VEYTIEPAWQSTLGLVRLDITYYNRGKHLRNVNISDKF